MTPTTTSGCRRLPAILFLTAIGWGFSRADEAGPAADETLPQPVTEEHFRALKENSPFRRVLDFERTYSLRGVARVDDEKVAWLFNRETEKTVTVHENQANDLGMTLVSVTNDPNGLDGVSVQVRIGGEGIKLSYDAARLAPAESGKKVEYDRWGRAVPPQRIIDKFKKLNREQMSRYQVWRTEMVKKNPEMDKSPKRFPVIEKAMDAILRGRSPEKY